MKDFRIIAASVMLVYLSSLSFSASASAGEREDEHRSSNTVGVRHEEDDSRSEHLSSRAKEVLKKMNELKKKREAEKKKKKSRTSTGTTLPPKPVSNTGSTSSGTTTPTQTTTAPVTKSATVNYNTPGGNVPVAFSVTVNNGVITAASSTTLSNGTSGYYQDSFAQGISSSAVGKKVSSLSLSAVGGASLTTNAFKQFVTSNF